MRFKFNIRPGQRACALFLILCVVMGLSLYLEIDLETLSLAFLACLAIVGFDFLTLLGRLNISVERQVSHTVPMGVKNHVTLVVKNNGNRRKVFEIFDHYPTLHTIEGLPRKIDLRSGDFAEVKYDITFVARGVYEFGQCDVKLESLLSLWHRYHVIGEPKEVKVYPNYSEVIKYGLLSAEQRLSQMGIHKQRKRGEGTDFHQLREFRNGDTISKVDWKASARVRKMIAKDYQQEQDQQIIFLLDCGRTMRAIDDGISHFDHTLNALLLLGSVAVRQGDEVGLLTMGGEERWMQPQKGVSAVNRLLNVTFDLQTSKENTDILMAAGKLRALVKKRALIVLISNLRDEGSADWIKAIRLLQQKHLVFLASLREESLDQKMKEPVEDLDSALMYSSLTDYLRNRQRTFKLMGEQKVFSIDVTPKNLANSLVNLYLSIKSSGVL